LSKPFGDIIFGCPSFHIINGFGFLADGHWHDLLIHHIKDTPTKNVTELTPFKIET
jgi:hypothetical protein